MLLVRGSLPKKSIRSPQVTSSFEPVETNELNPTFSRKLQSRIAVSNAPLWLIKATFPGRAIECAKVAFNPRTGFITPRQFGPISRILPRMIWEMRASSSLPCSPCSLKPAEITMPAGTPAATDSARTSGTESAGVVTTTRSTLSGSSETLGYALIPNTLGRFEFTGNTVPPKGLLNRFHSTDRPTLPGRSVAPITATLRGANNASSGWLSERYTSEEGSALANGLLVCTAVVIKVLPIRV